MGMQDFGQTIVADADSWLGVDIPTSAEALKLLKTKNPIILIQKERININNHMQIQLAKGLRLPALNGSVNYSAYGNENKKLFDAINNDWNQDEFFISCSDLFWWSIKNKSRAISIIKKAIRKRLFDFSK